MIFVKQAKRILLVGLCLLLCLSLTGCKELDDLRARHAIRQEDGTLLLGEQVYKALPGFSRELNLDTDYEGRTYVTQPDVPVLLCRMMSSRNAYSMGDGIIIYVMGEDVDVYYCREDLYDTYYNAILADAPMTKMFYTYYEPEVNKYCEYYLTDAEHKAVWMAYAEGELRDMYEVSTQYAVSLGFCTEDELFREHAITIEYSDDGYYLLDSTNDFVKVPDEYNAIFDKLLEKDRLQYSAVFWD